MAGLHTQSGQHRAAQDALRFGQTGQQSGDRALPSGVIPAAPEPPENSGTSPRFIEKCWWEPDPTLPAKGTGETDPEPVLPGDPPMMMRVSTSASAAATGGCGDKEISN